MNELYVISGISGSGKTTLGKELANKLNLMFIDQDFYFIKNKPKITLSNGLVVSNYDCYESINTNFKQDILDKLKITSVLLVGFALSRNMLPILPKIHIHLVTDDIEKRCIEARRQSKNINVENDILMIKEVIIPFYNFVLQNSDITQYINVYNNGVRKQLNNIMNECIL